MTEHKQHMANCYLCEQPRKRHQLRPLKPGDAQLVCRACLKKKRKVKLTKRDDD